MSGSEYKHKVSVAQGPTKGQIRRWRRYLADEIAEGQIYRSLAERSVKPEKDILLGLAEAEDRHAQHWRALLGEYADVRRRPSFHRGLLRLLARMFGSVFVLALMQRSESNTPYKTDSEVPREIAADEAIHEEVVRGLAARGRETMAGNFRAAVFGANDGLVSNLALVMGVGATGVAPAVVLFTGIAGLFAGALSMGAGEYVSVRSQRELLEASNPTHVTLRTAKHLDIEQNELELVYRARGMSSKDASHRALERLGYLSCDCNPTFSARPDGSQGPEEELQQEDFEAVGNPWKVAFSSFLFFSSGAIIPVAPFLLGATGLSALAWALGLVSLALLVTGGIVGLLSGASPFKRAMRQLGIGLGAAGVTYVLGMLFEI